MDIKRWKYCTIRNSSFRRNCNRSFDGPVPATPFKTRRHDLKNSQVNLEDIKTIYYQKNYTDQILHIFLKQVNMVSTQIETIAKKMISIH